MAEYTCGSFGIRFKGIGGTWRAVQKHEKGFLLWESETHGSRAKKVLTDREGNVLINGVVSFNDFAVKTKISQYENIKNSISCAQIMAEMVKQEHKEDKDSSKKGEDSSHKNPPAEDNSSGDNSKKVDPLRPAPKAPGGRNARGRESVISKLHEYQIYVENKKKKA